MKTFKKVLFIVAFFAVAVSASAQFNWGVKAGFNASTIYGASGDDSKVSYRPGFHVGLMGQYMVTEKFGLESGLYYSTLGFNGTYDDRYDSQNYSKGETKVGANYLQLPISALYKIKVGENLSLNPSLGIYLGYGIGGKAKFTETGVEDGEAYNYNVETDYFGKNDAGKENVNRFDMGATVGLNLQFEKFLIGLGYDYGFAKINKQKATDGDKNLYNGNIRVSLGYFF